MQNLLTTEQVAEELGVSTKSVARYVESGGLPFYLIGTHRRFKLDEVLQWAKRNATEAVA